MKEENRLCINNLKKKSKKKSKQQKIAELERPLLLKYGGREAFLEQSQKWQALLALKHTGFQSWPHLAMTGSEWDEKLLGFKKDSFSFPKT